MARKPHQDYGKLPAFIDPEACPFCDTVREAATGSCHHCLKPITDGPMPGYPVGYRSQSASHLHVTNMGGQMRTEPMFNELCRVCYRLDWVKIFPGTPCQV